MRLVDLDANFFVHVQAGDREFLRHPPTAEGAHGVAFDDPNGSGNRINVWFANPLCIQVKTGERGWTRTGTTLEDLTLSPSIDAKGIWHGFVRSGTIDTV